MKRLNKVFTAFKSYVKVVSDINISTDLNEDIGEMLGRKRSTIENIGKSRKISFEEAQVIVEYLVDKAKGCKYADNAILWRLSFELMRCTECSDETIKTVLEPLFKDMEMKWNGPADPVDKNKTGIIADNTARILPVSNRDLRNIAPVLPRTKLCDDFYRTVNGNQVAMIVGRKGTGKEALIKRIIINDLEEKHKYGTMFFFSGRNFDYSNMLSQILYSIRKQFTSSLSIDELASQAVACMASFNNLLVFENVNDLTNISLDQIVSFCLRVAGNTDIVLLSERRDRNIMRRFDEKSLKVEAIRMPSNIKKSEWQELAQYLKTRRSNVRLALDADPSIVDWLYDLGETELDSLKESLYYIASRIENGVPISLIKNKFEKERKKIVFNEERVRNSLSHLSEDEKKVAAAVALFDKPVCFNEICMMVGIDGVDEDMYPEYGSPLENAIQGCRDKDVLDNIYFPEADVAKLHIPHTYKTYIRKKIREDQEAYKDIIDGWVNYYISSTKEIGMCYDKLELLSKYDDNSSNMSITEIENVLYFCEQNCRWSDYYSISYNTRYYFYMRGISGTDKNNVHLKRAMAATKLNDANREFEARLYYCNVCSKKKSTDLVEFNFMIMEKLEKNNDIDLVMRAKFRYVKGLYCLSLGEYGYAVKWFDEYFSMIGSKYLVIPDDCEKNLRYDINAAKRWKCDCLCHMAELEPDKAKDYLVQIEKYADEVEKECESFNFTRALVHSKLIRARILQLVDGRSSETADIMNELKTYKELIEADSYHNKYYIELQKREQRYDKQDIE